MRFGISLGRPASRTHLALLPFLLTLLVASAAPAVLSAQRFEVSIAQSVRSEVLQPDPIDFRTHQLVNIYDDTTWY